MADEKHTQTPGPAGCSRAKAEGSFIALAAGDALGWPQEFPKKLIGKPESNKPSLELRSWMRRGGNQYYPHEEPIRRGEYSDDTQLTLAVARARLVAGDSWWTVLTRTELPLWTLYERGGGGATKRAIACWLKGASPWSGAGRDVKRYFDAGGNGVAMRVLPHAIFYAGADNPALLIRDVIRDGVATHGHPRALIGAAAYAFAAWWLLRADKTIRFGELVDVLLEGQKTWGTLPEKPSSKNGWLDAANRQTSGDYEALWSNVVSEMTQLLEQVRTGLAAGAIGDDDEILRGIGCFGKSKGAGTVSTAASVYLCARYAAQPTQAVLKAAFAHGADTDTIAAMTGGLVGALAGSDWMSTDWLSVQDCEYIRTMANAVARGPDATQERPRDLRKIGKKDIDSLIDSLAQGHKGKLDLDGVRRSEIIDTMSPKPLSKTTLAQVWQIRTDDGQTIYVTKLGRRPKDKKPKKPETDRQVTLSVTPHEARISAIKLSVADLNGMVRFYESVFDMKPTKKDSKFVSYGVLSFVDARYAADISGKAVKNGETGRSRIEVCVGDLDATFARAKKAGCVVQPIKRMSREQSFFQCRDLEGNIIEVSAAKRPLLELQG
ncbi:MAG: ADP-ribosylglycohydrolase family protein [Hyphomicrobiales bacterium]|nr:ADP-ribosylglycohydrolase family protein [Hyphomicrobiales bacterium]